MSRCLQNNRTLKNFFGYTASKFDGKLMQVSNVLKLDLTKAAAEKLLRELALDSSKVVFSKHANGRGNQRKISHLQILECLRKGRIIEGPAKAIKGNWELKVTYLSAGEPINVVAALDWQSGLGNYVIVVTTYK